MPVGAHALLGASGSHRWLVCPPIARLESEIEDRGSVFAEEGTAAHDLSELKLMYQTEKINKRTFNTRFNKFKKENEFYSKEMDEYTDEYVDRVLEAYNSYPSADIDLEKKVDFSRWVPEGFGTSDVVILSDGIIEIIDLKYGKGVPVDAYQNPQIMLYALGSYVAYDMLYDFDTIKMTIIQPRLDSISSFEIPVEELLYWADNYVAPRAAQAWEGIGEWTITDDVVKWSKVAGQLRPRAEKNLELIDRYDYKEAPLLEPEEIAEILDRANEIKKWIEQVEYYALEQVRDHGAKIPGFKLVEGRSNRKITDPEKVAEILRSAGYDDLYKPEELLAMGELEKKVGKKNFSELVKEYITKPTGKPVLVVESDKREEIGSAASAAADFDEYEEEIDLLG
ncbi:DUF2800 domain-containing protein [Enterococcus sp. 5H]|uniref:DUF2800 domain-containing protein n=1 Tax=Enterococcus sp. 5H TaxID=1229490 RepID=UPI0023037794|nr:DUF2800 domain-containing protein [Enterococcus sp. 5H]MDA9472667.1 Phage protein [Enterococcus sp. 5H]